VGGYRHPHVPLARSGRGAGAGCPPALPNSCGSRDLRRRMLPSGQGAWGELGQSIRCKGRPRGSPPPWQAAGAAGSAGLCVQLAASPVAPFPLMWVGSTQCHPGAGQDLCWDPPAARGCSASVLEVPLGPLCVTCPRERPGLEECPSAHDPPPCSPPRGGEPPSVALTESPFCVAFGLCTYLMSVGAQTSVLAQDGISPLETFPMAVRPPRTATLLGSQPPRDAAVPWLSPAVDLACSPAAGLALGGLSRPRCCQTNVCVPGHQARSMLLLLLPGLSLSC